MNLMLYITDDADVWSDVVNRAIIGFSFLAIVFILLISVIGTQKLEAHFKALKKSETK